MTEQYIRNKYSALLRAHVAEPKEKNLAAMAGLGRELVLARVPEEEAIEIHEEALHRLSQEFPEMTLRDTASPISGLLIEMLMAYSLASREQLEERKRAEEELDKYQKHLEELVEERTNQLKEKTAELKRANLCLQEVDRLKSIFLASMSHELRTPLNSIIGFTSILLQGISGALTDEQKKQLTMVKGSGQHLLDLINDLLDVSKIEAGKVEISVEEFALADVANEVTEAISPTATKKELDVVTELQDDIVLLSDRRRVKQLLMNLVSNAIKFTNQGQVTITGKRLDNEQVEFQVSDTGIGMKQEDIQRLFQPFQQIDESLTKEHGGTGLGLYLCKKIVDLLHGDIRAESEYGTGTTFTVTLPLLHESETRGMNEQDPSD